MNKDRQIKVPNYNNFVPTHKGTSALKNVKSVNTKPEVRIRKALFNRGFRYSLNSKRLPGKPDIVLTKYKTVIFVDGDFWHGRNWEERKKKLKVNTEYWIPKIERNMQRDRERTVELEQLGWRVIRIWEYEIKKDVCTCVEFIESQIL